MKILLDHNLDRRLKQHLDDFNCATAHECGWANVVNGELLRLAETNRFDVLLTADSNIKQQQNLTGRSIAIVVLRAYSNRLAVHLEMLDMIRRTLGAIEPGEIIEVFHPDMAN